jgi:hypothetical protein
MDDILVNISSSIEEVIINVSSSNENVNVIISEFRGRSAYQVWLDAGNVGTENDFFIYLSQVGTSASFEDVYERKGKGILSGSVLNYIPVIVSGSSQIDVLGTQNFTTISSSIDLRLDTLEGFSSSLGDGFVTDTELQLTASVIENKINVTASLFNTFSSSINTTIKTKLDIDGVISGSSQVQLSGINGTTFANTNFTFPQDLVVQGKLTAQEFYTELISSSIIYESGSTKFGDSLDDTHIFTGSILVNGRINVSGSITGSLRGTADTASYVAWANIDNKPIYVSQSVYTNDSASFNSRLNNIQLFTQSIDSRVDNIELTTHSLNNSVVNINNFTSSTDNRLDNIELFTSSINTTIKTKLDTEGVISGSSQLTSSYDQRYILSGSITETTWDNIANKPSDIVSSSSQLTSSFDIRYALSGSGALPPGVVSGSSQLTGSYDTRYETQGRSLLSGSILNYIPVIVSGSSQINFTQLSGISTNIISSSTDTQNVDVIITGGSISANLKGGVVSGSSQIDVIGTQNYSTLATTGSNTFNGNQIISGSLEVDIDTIILSGSMYVSGTIEVIAITGSLSGIAATASYVEYQNVVNKPTLVSGSSQLTSSYDQRYIISGTITQTTWDNIANKPDGIVSGSSQINIYDTTNYVNFSSSLSDTNVTQSLRLTDIELFTQSIDSRVDNIEITTASINLRLDNLEIESGSIRTTFNQFTASYNTGSFTGSFIGDLIGTSSYALTASYIDGGFY